MRETHTNGGILMVFKSKKDKFASSLISISQNLKESADYFADYKLNNVSELKVFSGMMKEYEHKGDSMVHEVIKDLNNAFITPIEREDILALTMSMDDVLDELEHCAALFEMYSIVHADEYMVKFIGALKQCTYEIETAIDLLTSKKLQEIRKNAIKIKDLEAICDNILRQSIKNLFTVEKDPIRIIQFKEIYESLEEVADHCQSVANTLETIVMKNA
jgi:predicted phosphate transport protein (TIGR00153 family)